MATTTGKTVVMLLWAAILGLWFALSGCSTNVSAPSPLSAARTPDQLASIGSFTDMGIVMYATAALDGYEGSNLTNEILALSGGGAIGGLGTGAVAAPPAAQGLLLGANTILMVMNLWRPLERAGAYSQGSGLIRDSLGAYLQAVILDGYCTVPTNRVTPAGATLFANVNSAIKLVNDLRQGILDLGSQSVKQLQAARAQAPVTTAATIPEGCK